MSEEEKESDYTVQIIRGCPFPNAAWFSRKNIEDAMDYVPKDGDVIIASYPKTGTTWLQYIVLQVISKGEFPTFDDVSMKVVPFLEMSGIAALEAIESKPRIYKHHISYGMVQKSDKSKCIYIYRDPEDTVVSLYHFIRNLQSEAFSRDSFNKFFNCFVAGKLSYGNYFRHVLSFYEHREDDNLLMVSYEKLQANRRGEILRIAEFLGDEYRQCLQENEGVFDKVVEHTTFEYMKKNLYLTHPDNMSETQTDKPKINFFRKGVVGDGKNVLTDDQQQLIKEGARKFLGGTSIINEWYPD